MAYWIEFEDGTAGCVDAAPKGQAIEKYAATIGRGPVASVQRLPYPRRPRLTHNDTCPTFCIGPLEQCLDRGACPREYACND